jgi:hypothetical protein
MYCSILPPDHHRIVANLLHTLPIEEVLLMWGFVDDVMDMVPRKRNRGMSTMTALLLGAGIGITAWEVMRRRNPSGNADMAKIAQTVIDAVKE